MVAIGVDQSLRNFQKNEYRRLKIIKNLSKSSGNVIINNSTTSLLDKLWYTLMRYLLKNSNITYPIYEYKKVYCNKIISSVFRIIQRQDKTSVRKLCAAKYLKNEIRSTIMLWSSLPKSRVHPKTNQQVKNLLTIGFYNIPRLYISQYK